MFIVRLEAITVIACDIQENKKYQYTPEREKGKGTILKRVVRTEQGLQIMEYKINTDDAKKFIEKVLKYVKEGKAPKGNEIKTWGVKTTSVKNTSERIEVLVHTADQWEEKGVLIITPNEQNDVVLVEFRYWKTYPKEQRDENDKNYILGRFTELMLVHFPNLFQKIHIG